MKFVLLQILISFFCCKTIDVCSQNSTENKQEFYQELAFLIGDSWYLEITTDGFQVTFCRTCMESYNSYFDSTDFFTSKLKRSDFFSLPKLDSISYFSTVSNIPIPFDWSSEKKIECYKENYRPNDVLKFNIRIERLMSKKEIELIQVKNDKLKEVILKEPIYKISQDVFSDYRFWLPSANWKNRTKEFDYYFERLPYYSSKLNKSVFIEHNKPFFFSEPMLVDNNDQEFFYKSKNNLENEIRKVLKIIALNLILEEFNLLN